MTLTPKMLLLLLLLLLLQTGSQLVPQYRLNVKSVMVLEGTNIHVPCNFIYPGQGSNKTTPVYGYWFRKGAKVQQDALMATNNQRRAVLKKTQGRFRLLGDPQNYNCSLEIRDAQRNDTGTYFFRVERGDSVKYSYKGNQLSVCVMALSQTPDISIQGTLESGHRRNITCTVPRACKRVTPPTFTWIPVNLTALGPRTPYFSVVTLTPRPQHHGTNLTCRATFHGGVSTERTIWLNVSYAPQDLTISVFRKECTGPEVLGNGSSLPVQEGDSLRLLCVTHSNPPALLSWAQRGQTLQPSHPSDPGVLELPQIQIEHEGKFTCYAQNRLGSQWASLSLSVVRRPGPRTGVVQGAAGGAGVVALLALCLCVIFFLVKIHRERSTEKAQGQRGVSVSHLKESPLDSRPNPPPPDEAMSTSEKDGELHYASLSFHGLKPPNHQDQEATEYSEIKIRK